MLLPTAGWTHTVLYTLPSSSLIKAACNITQLVCAHLSTKQSQGCVVCADAVVLGGAFVCHKGDETSGSVWRIRTFPSADLSAGSAFGLLVVTVAARQQKTLSRCTSLFVPPRNFRHGKV